MAGNECADLFGQYASGAFKDKAAETIATRSPDCACESWAFGSPGSPGPVANEEEVASCAFDPNHYDGLGNLTHKFVAKAFGVGLSVSRLDVVNHEDEVTALCEKLAERRSRSTKQTISRGWLSASVGCIRSLCDPQDPARRMFCVYATPRDGAVAHADVMATRYFDSKPDSPEAHLHLVAARSLLKLFLISESVSRGDGSITA